MSEFIDSKLNVLGRWLRRKSLSDEACDLNLIKTAVSLEEMIKTLYSSKRIPKIIKNIYWEKDMNYDSSELEYLSKEYSSSIHDVIPNDLEPRDQALAMQWLISLGSKDISFAKRILVNTAVSVSQGSDISYPILDILSEEYSEEDPILGEAFRGEAFEQELKRSLERFFHWKSFMSEKDLMSIKSYDEFKKIILEAEVKIKEYEDNKQYLNADEGTKLLGVDYDGWEAFAITNKGAACQVGKGTQWCTAAPGVDWFKTYYHPEDPLFVLKNEEGDRYQVHFGTNQFKDVLDKEVSGEVRNILFEKLIALGADKFLSTQMYAEYSEFLQQEDSYSDDQFVEMTKKFKEFMHTVVDDKIESRQTEAIDSYLVSVVLEELENQIDDNKWMELDSVASDEAAQLLASYSPNTFFRLGLAPDYPAMAEDAFLKALGSERVGEPTIWAKKVEPLRLYDQFASGDLFLTDEVSSLIETSEEVRRDLADAVVRNNGRKLLLGHAEFPKESEKILNEFYPNLQNDLAASVELVEDSRFSLVLGDKSDLTIYDLVSSNFYLRFPEYFKKLLDQITDSITDTGLRGSEVWSLNSLFREMRKAGIIHKFFDNYIKLLREGLKADFATYSDEVQLAASDKNLSKEMSDEVLLTKKTQQEDFSAALILDTERRFPHWRAEEMTEEELYDIYQLTTTPSAASSDTKEKYKAIDTFYNKIIIVIKDKLRKMQGDRVTGKKFLDLHPDILSYIATFLPSLWDTYNLDFRDRPSRDTLRKATDSIRKLDQAKATFKAAEDPADLDDTEDDEDY
jgi:hypothetical protein